MKWLLPVLLVLFLAVPVLHAQGYGKIVGSVADPSGAVVGSATVTATQADTGRTTVVRTDKDGAYVFPSLPPAPYSISATATGFQTNVQKGITLQADQALTVNLQLQVGASTDTVTVSAQDVQVDTSTGTLSQDIDESRVVDLPLNGRQAASLVTLVAGVVVAPADGLDQGTTKSFPGQVSITANGSQSDQSNFLLNGGNNLDEMTDINAPFPFPDALQEFSVQTSNYSAQYGQSAGAVVNIVSKAGGNRFHGDAFEFVRNGVLDARPYFAATRDSLHRHQFGGTIGGPVKIPHLSSGARTQFFFGYQHTLLHNLSSSSSAVVPTLAEEGLDPTNAGYNSYGDFSSLCSGTFSAAGVCSTSTQQLYDPINLTGGKPTPFAFNHIPVARMDPASRAVEADIPSSPAGYTPAAGAVGTTVFYSKPTTQIYNEYFSRVDHSFSDKDHLFGHYYYNDFNQAGIYNPTELLSYASYSNIRYQNALLSETHTFTSNLLNELVINYQREVSLRGGPAGSPDITAFGVKNIFQPSQGNVLNSVNASGYFSVSASAFANFERNNYTFNDDVHWVKGHHNFGFGGHIELSKYDLTNVGNENGNFGFNATNTNNALASYQIGYLSSFVQGTAEFLADRNHFPGLYAQDSWKATRRLTLNYGVRWETFSPWSNKYGEQTVFSPQNYSSGVTSSVFTTLPAGMLVAGDPGVVPNGVRSQYKQFMPRLGFAYDVFGDSKTSLRGGAGIFYQDRLPGFFNQSQGANTPYTINVSLTNPTGPFSNPYCTGCATGSVANPFPYTLPFPSNYTFPTPITLEEYDPSGNFRVPATYNFNLTLEQQLANKVAFRLAYVGSQTRHQFVNLDINPAVNNGTSLSTDQRRAYNSPPVLGPCTTTVGCQTKYKQIVEASMEGSGNYNSLQATLEKQMSKGFSLLFNYTWSRALDNLPYVLNVSNTVDINPGESYVLPLYPAGVSAYNPTNIKALDHGPSDFDHPNTLSASYVFQFPKVRGSYGFVRAITNGWRTTGLVQHHTGDALTASVSTGKDISLTGLMQDRAQLTGKPVYSAQSGTGNCTPTATVHCQNFFSPAGFALPVNTGPGTGFGNAVKGSLRGPAYTDWDAALIRTFPVFRESSLDFRAEFFDVLNHTILSDPATVITSGTFGEITGENAAGPRIGQLSLKLTF